MSYKNFNRVDFIKELDKNINNLSKYRNNNKISNSMELTSLERSYLIDIDDKLKNIQKDIQEYKITYLNN